MNFRYYNVIKTILIGLCAAQIIAWLHVYLSNIEFIQTIEVLKAFGYKPAIDNILFISLKNPFTAFKAGLFFTFSIGLAFSITVLALNRIWSLFIKKRLLTILYIFLWCWCLISIQYNGFSLWGSLYLFCIPAFVWTACLIRLPKKSSKNSIIAVFTSIIVIIFLFFSVDGLQGFRNFRDRILISNFAGKAVSNFYYKYSLYSAFAIKPLNSKPLKTVTLENLKDISLENSLKEKLYKEGFFYINSEKADLEIKKDKNSRLSLYNKGRLIMEVLPRELILNTKKIVNIFSTLSDKTASLRDFIYISLFIGPAVSLYLIFFSLVNCLIYAAGGRKHAQLYSAAFSMLLSILIFYYAFI